MQCFICVTYMLFICSAHPSKDRELAPNQHEKRSLFRDVIESLRIRSQIPDDFNQNDENNLAQNFDRYGYENDPQLPSDVDFIPRRNDRIAMPPLKYRFPKSINFTDDTDTKEEIVLYINTTNEPKPSTQKPKKQKKTRPPANKNKVPNKNKDEEVEDENETQKPEEYLPFTNTMAGQSQIGNRESQMVVKPTVIVNIRGTVSHRDSDIRIEGRDSNETLQDVPQNVFNIKQEIKLERNFAGVGSNGGHKDPEVRQNVRVISESVTKGEEDMMMCETATFNPEKTGRGGRKYDNVFQILFSL